MAFFTNQELTLYHQLRKTLSWADKKQWLEQSKEYTDDIYFEKYKLYVLSCALFHWTTQRIDLNLENEYLDPHTQINGYSQADLLNKVLLLKAETHLDTLSAISHEQWLQNKNW